ncbi:MAG: 4-hydroxythreonine-4-phosphate dehydrogenase PdxA [Elusimicrobia bacterium]|nr:4-hydroxythreonine-4-phosphate dehydrogenase PdxA [Elusimicrobiota bacterium]
MSAALRPSNKPILAFTCGDPAGIGAQAVLGALRGKRPLLFSPVLVGEPWIWRRAGWCPGRIPCVSSGPVAKPVPYGKASRAGGRCSFESFRLAVKLAGEGLVDALVTAPISKKSWEMAGVGFTDHTEFLRSELGLRAQMVLASPPNRLWCVTATRHIPLARVPGSLDVETVRAAAEGLHMALRIIGIPRPRLGLCGLNPHAGEDGLLGPEERRVLIPAARRARREGIGLTDPIPADTAWRWHRQGRLDGLICLYHDQALIGLKASAGLEIVNWTVGLPFPRVSPGHGTGFDIAGKKRPDSAPTRLAAELAASIISACGRASGRACRPPATS